MAYSEQVLRWEKEKKNYEGDDEQCRAGHCSRAPTRACIALARFKIKRGRILRPQGLERTTSPKQNPRPSQLSWLFSQQCNRPNNI